MDAQQTQLIDPIKYQGDWYLIGSKPSFLDKNWINTKEHYTWDAQNGFFDVVATYNKKPGGKLKTTKEKVIPLADSNFTKWTARIWLFIHADYYIYKIADDYSYVVIGHPKQKYLYIMARKPEMDADLYREMIEFAVDLGYKREEILRHVQESQKSKVNISTTLDALRTTR